MSERKIVLNEDSCKNIKKEKDYDKNRVKKNAKGSYNVAEKPRRYKHVKKGIPEEDTKMGGGFYGVREGDGRYKPPEGASKKGEDSTTPIDSTRYLETSQGIKSYSQLYEILAVGVAKKIEEIIASLPEEIVITPEWICRIHKDIAGSLFPDWAGRFRDVDVHVGQHTPPPFYEVPVNMRFYCDDLSIRLSIIKEKKGIKEIAELFAWIDWRFQWIHPFKDFNGRVGRILLSAILFKLKLPPARTASIEPDERDRYLKALHSADSGDLALLTKIWTERLMEAVEEGNEE